MIQEIHTKETGLHEFTLSHGKKEFLYNSDNEAKLIRGVGIITTESTNVTFNLVSKQICIVTTKTNDTIKCHLLSAYAPTLEKKMKNSY